MQSRTAYRHDTLDSPRTVGVRQIVNLLLFHCFLASSVVISFKGAFWQYETIISGLRLIGLACGVLYCVSNARSAINSYGKVLGLVLLLLFSLLANHDSISGILTSALMILVVGSFIRPRATIDHSLSQIAGPVLWFVGATMLMLLFVNLHIRSALGKFEAVSVTNQNYIASTFFVITMLCISSGKRTALVLGVLSALVAILLASRTSVLALIVAGLFGLKKKRLMFVVLFSPIWALPLVGFMLDKWGASTIAQAAGGRTGPWLYYLERAVDSPISLLPNFISGLSPSSYAAGGVYHLPPHNLFIQAVIEFGWIFGLIFVGMVAVSLFGAGSRKGLAVLVGFVAYSMLEPTIWFTNNLISAIFFLLVMAGFVRVIDEMVRTKEGDMRHASAR